MQSIFLRGLMLLLLSGSAALVAAEPEHADLVIQSARLWTGTVGGTGQAEALAISGNRISAIGSKQQIARLIGPDTRVVDAHGKSVIPGITDSHIHLTGGGLQLGRLNLREARNREEFVRLVREAASSRSAGQWVQGGRWSVESWDDPTQPDKSWLDKATGDVPVFLNRMDGHQALVNSAALKLAGIDGAGPPDPPGGEIQRDPATGAPTGILKESAMDLVSQLIPAPSDDERRQAVKRAMAHLNSVGITSVHDMADQADIPVYRELEERGELTVRISAYITSDDWRGHAASVAKHVETLNSDMLRVRGFKGYMDGSLGSRTAYMSKPYQDTADSPYPRGQLTAFAADQEEFRKTVAAMDALGLQLAVHAIGDEANHLLLDAYEFARVQNKDSATWHRIEHAQHLREDDIPRFAKLRVIASMQPYHKADDGRYAEQALDATQLPGSYAFKNLSATGVILGFGSDWPVVTADPFAGMDAAINARTLDGSIWLPENSLTLEQALTAYTASPPRSVKMGERLGTLEPGSLADVVVLSEDIFTMPPSRIGEVRATMTIVDGRIIFER